VNRRRFVQLGASTVGLAALTGCALGPAALTQKQLPRIGLLTFGSFTTPPSIARRNWDAFTQGLAERGWIEGQTITIERRAADSVADRLPQLVNELLAAGVVLIVAVTTQAITAAKQATSVTPIVFMGGTDAVQLGFVASLANPGGNLTGFDLGPDLMPKRLDLLRELVPGLARVAFLNNFGNPASAQVELAALPSAASQLGLQTTALDVRNEADVWSAFTAARTWPAEALLIGDDPLLGFQLQAQIVQLAAENHLPAMYAYAYWVEGGGLICYGVNLPDQYRRAAIEYVDPILRGTKKVSDLPVQHPKKFDVLVNQSTAAALGLTIPLSVAGQVTQWIA
jgi:putative ABC transport system substrate-binding protein